MTSATEKDFSARRRRRASMACLNCRKSRIRCKVDPGQNGCNQCSQAGIECTYDARDGRKNRANSKAVANELTKRIRHLEALLKESGQGHEIPQASPVLQDHRDASSMEQDDPHMIENSRPMETDSDAQSTPFYDEDPPAYIEDAPSQSTITPTEADSQSKAIVGKLIPQPVRFDMASGRVRFFGPTTNMHILSRSSSYPNKTQESFWPISALVRDLSPDTHDYLVDLFFDCHNSSLHIVHKWAFFDDLRAGGSQFYSNFLHMCLLAEGYRYADRNRSDIKKLAGTGPDSSIFHTKAKKMAELELVKPGGVPSLQAFFLLGDLEVGIGRDDTGWMFAGMAFRLLFDVGLHVDPCELNLTDREVQIRHMVLWACIMNDVYWALYLGRPTMLKASDIAPACLNKDFDPLIESQTRTYAYEKTIETKVYEALLQLMDFLEPLCETRDLRKYQKPSDAYLKISALNRKLNNWYSELPERLRWTEENIRSAPPGFYLLHTQYHTALILLHRSFPTRLSQSSTQHTSTTHFSTLSRNVCISNAIRVAEIIGLYQQRFTVQRIFVTGLQHVGTAATALMAEISMLQSEQDVSERTRLLEHLSNLRHTLRDMTCMYQPANLMSTVVDHFIRDFDTTGHPDDPSTSRSPNMGTITELSTSKHYVAPPSQPATRAHSVLNIDPSLASLTSSLFPPTHSRGVPTSVFGNTPLESSGGLPFMPSSWFEEMNWEEDTEFLNLMGLRDLQNAGAAGLGLAGLDDGFESSGILGEGE